MSYTDELSTLTSIIISVNEQIATYKMEKERTRLVDEEEWQKLCVKIDNNIDDCKELYQECDRLFDEIMTKYHYYGKNMCHDIYDKIYSYDDINDESKSIYLPSIKKLNSGFGILMDNLIDDVQQLSEI